MEASCAKFKTVISIGGAVFPSEYGKEDRPVSSSRKVECLRPSFSTSATVAEQKYSTVLLLDGTASEIELKCTENTHWTPSSWRGNPSTDTSSPQTEDSKTIECPVPQTHGNFNETANPCFGSLPSAGDETSEGVHPEASDGCAQSEGNSTEMPKSRCLKTPEPASTDSTQDVEMHPIESSEGRILPAKDCCLDGAFVGGCGDENGQHSATTPENCDSKTSDSPKTNRDRKECCIRRTRRVFKKPYWTKVRTLEQQSVKPFFKYHLQKYFISVSLYL